MIKETKSMIIVPKFIKCLRAFDLHRDMNSRRQLFNENIILDYNLIKDMEKRNLIKIEHIDSRSYTCKITRPDVIALYKLYFKLIKENKTTEMK